MLLSAVRDYTTFFSTNNAQFAAQGRVTELGSGGYNLLVIIGAFGLVIGLIITFISIMLGGSKQVAESKGKLLRVVILGVVLFSISGIIAAVFAFGTGLKF